MLKNQEDAQTLLQSAAVLLGATNLVRVSVFLRVRAAQGRLVGQRLRTTY